MKKDLKILLYSIIILLLLGAGTWLWRNFKGSAPASRNSDEKIINNAPNPANPNLPEAVNNTGFPLKLPKGFAISIFAKDLPGARVMAIDENGNIWLSQTREGRISRLDIKDGKVVRQATVLSGLHKLHGLVFDPEFPHILYYAEESKISYINIQSAG